MPVELKCSCTTISLLFLDEVSFIFKLIFHLLKLIVNVDVTPPPLNNPKVGFSVAFPTNYKKSYIFIRLNHTFKTKLYFCGTF